jgi:hypothetical protein
LILYDPENKKDFSRKWFFAGTFPIPVERGHYPSSATKEVWDIDPETSTPVHIADDSWALIDKACRQDGRGLYGLKSLKEFKKKHNLSDIDAPKHLGGRGRQR